MSEQKTEEQTKEQQGTEDGDKGHNPDKAIQKLQMKLANQEKATASILAKLDELSKPKDPPAKAAKDPFGDLGDDDTVDAATLKGALRGLTETFKADIDKHFDVFRDSMQAEQEARRADQFWNTWEKEHPGVSTQRKDFLENAADEVDTKYPNLDTSNRATAVQLVFDRMVEEAELKLKSADADTDKDPPKSTKGTKISQDGANKSKPATEQEKDDDEMLIRWVDNSPEQV